MMMKTLSVVVRCSNDAPSLNRCLASLCRQSYPGELMEIIVADSAGRLQSQQLVRWWSAKGAGAKRAQPELRYLKVSRNRDLAILDAARFACGAIIVCVDDSLQVTTQWCVDGVASAMDDLHRGADIGAIERGRFVLRQDVLLGDGQTPRQGGVTQHDPRIRSFVGELRPSLAIESHGRFYAALLLLLATLTFAVVGELHLAFVGALAWCSITCWLALQLLQTNVVRSGGWRELLRFRRHAEEPEAAVVTPIFSSKQSRDGTQRI